MSAFVYLLQHSMEPRFKIGKADDIGRRVAQLGTGFFNFDKSRALSIDNCAEATNLERTLHRVFRKHRLIPGVASPEKYPGLTAGKHDGMTEWFALDCWPRVMQFLAENKDLLEHEMLPDNHCQTIMPTTPIPVVLRQSSSEKLRAQLLRDKALKDGALARAEAIGIAIQLASGTAKFSCVVNSGQSYLLVGESKIGKGAEIRRILKRTAELYDLVVSSKHNMFALLIPGVPGLRSADAVEFDCWLDRLVWEQDVGVPGFDQPVSWKDTRQAAQMLSKLDIFAK